MDQQDQHARQQSMAGMSDNSASVDPALEGDMAEDDLEEEEEVTGDDDTDPVVTQNPEAEPMRDA